MTANHLRYYIGLCFAILNAKKRFLIKLKSNSIPMPKCEIYEDLKGEWRWRQVKKNGDIVEFSKKGFETREECEKNGKEDGPCTSYKLAL